MLSLRRAFRALSPSLSQCFFFLTPSVRPITLFYLSSGALRTGIAGFFSTPRLDISSIPNHPASHRTIHISSAIPSCSSIYGVLLYTGPTSRRLFKKPGISPSIYKPLGVSPHVTPSNFLYRHLIALFVCFSASHHTLAVKFRLVDGLYHTVNVARHLFLTNVIVDNWP